jgi:hypothetical protein
VGELDAVPLAVGVGGAVPLDVGVSAGLADGAAPTDTETVGADEAEGSIEADAEGGV